MVDEAACPIRRGQVQGLARGATGRQVCGSWHVRAKAAPTAERNLQNGTGYRALADVEGGRAFVATPAGHNLCVSLQTRVPVSASALASVYALQIQAPIHLMLIYIRA
jgi:hypothetical protein